MKAVTYQGPNKVQVKQVDDAKLEKKDDIIVKLLQPLFAVLIYIYIKATCLYLQGTLLVMNQWELLKKLVQMLLK